MIKNRNIALDAAIEQSKIRGLSAQGDTYYVVKRSSTLFEYMAARVDSGQLFVDVDSAINACTANHGDVIYVLPGHTENVATASAITADVAGVTILGIGSGADKPTFTFSSADNSATWVISAASVVLKNIIGTTSDDGLTNAFVVTGDNCELDLEWRDTSDILEVATAVRLDTANNATLNLVFKGFTTGNAVTSAVILDDCDNVNITIDGFGVVATAWVNMVDVASTNVKVGGTLYTQAITNYTRDVVNTIGGGSWSAQIYDASAGLSVEGGSAAALAASDSAAIAASIVTLQASVDTLDNIIDTEFPVVATAVGAVADATIADTIEGAAATTQSLVSDVKAVLQRIGADNANNTAATTLVDANDDGSLMERVEGLKDALILVRGTFTTSSATVPADIGRTEANDYWNGCYLVPTAGAIIGEPRLIVDFANAGGVFTLDTDIPFTAVPGLVAYVIVPGNAQIAPAANSSATATPAHVIGHKTDAVVPDATEGAAGTGYSLHAFGKAVLSRIGADNANNTVATTSVVANADGSVLEREEYIQTDLLALPRCVEKSDGAVLAAGDPIFNITGGPILCLSIVGIVTTGLEAAASVCSLQYTTVAPAATVEMSAAPVEVNGDVAGTSYQHINTTAILTPVTAGIVKMANSFATDETQFLLPIGTMTFDGAANLTGVIKWYLRYIPLSPLSRVVAAA